MNAVVESVRSLWVPLESTNLLVPNVAIAEVVSYQPLEMVEGGPDWLLGLLRWRDHELPVYRWNDSVATTSPRVSAAHVFRCSIR